MVYPLPKGLAFFPALLRKTVSSAISQDNLGVPLAMAIIALARAPVSYFSVPVGMWSASAGEVESSGDWGSYLLMFLVPAK
jgi:hypothetical protein